LRNCHSINWSRCLIATLDLYDLELDVLHICPVYTVHICPIREIYASGLAARVFSMTSITQHMFFTNSAKLIACSIVLK